MKLHIRHGRIWEFEHYAKTFKWGARYFEPGWYYNTPRNIYRVFIDRGDCPDVWVGLLMNKLSGPFWGTYEAELRATKLEFGRGVYYFGRIGA